MGRCDGDGCEHAMTSMPAAALSNRLLRDPAMSCDWRASGEHRAAFGQQGLEYRAVAVRLVRAAAPDQEVRLLDSSRTTRITISPSSGFRVCRRSLPRFVPTPGLLDHISHSLSEELKKELANFRGGRSKDKGQAGM
jgi:hypothetical protein